MSKRDYQQTLPQQTLPQQTVLQKTIKKKSEKILPYQTKEFFIKALDNPSDISVYNEKFRYIYINIAINELPVFQNLYNKFSSKIKIVNSEKFKILKNTKKVCEYVFMRLFRFMFYLDFLHDFGDKDRNNYIFKNIEQQKVKKGDLKIINKQKIENNKNNKKNEIIDTYHYVYIEDVKDIAFHVLDLNFNNINKLVLDENIQINISNFYFDKFDNISNLKKLSEEQIKELTLKIINFFDIMESSSYDSNKNCGETFDDIVKNINSKIEDTDKKVQLFIDADKYKLSYYPIILKFCSLLFDDDSVSNISSINLNTSLVNNYDSASGNKLNNIIDTLQKIYIGTKNINKLNSFKLPFDNLKIIFKLDRNDDYNNRYIELHFTRDDEKERPMLNINRFFTAESEDDKKDVFIDSSVGNVSIKMNDTLNKKNLTYTFIDEYFKSKDPYKNKKLLELFKQLFIDYYDDDKIYKTDVDKFKVYIDTIFKPKYLYDKNRVIRKPEEIKLLMTNYSFVLDSYAKTLGDFSQMILVYQLSKIHKDDIYLFITLDKIASYISSMFNSGTISENQSNPLEPLKYFTINYNLANSSSSTIDSGTITNTKTYSLFQKLKERILGSTMDTSSFGKTYYKKNLKNNKIERIQNLAKKYNVSYKNLTYKKLHDKLYKLYNLQLLAKKMKIPITYTKKSKDNKKVTKRFYKTIVMLESEIKLKNKKI